MWHQVVLVMQAIQAALRLPQVRRFTLAHVYPHRVLLQFHLVQHIPQTVTIL
jgi:hypothetical protein